MPLAIVECRAALGLQAPLITIEAHLSNGLPAFSIVGLPETAVKESKDRVRSAILNSQFDFHAQRITVNLAPADLPKEGARYDLAIALGILAASGQIPMASLLEYEVAGELALSGELRPIRGILPLAMQTAKAKKKLMLPIQNVEEALLCDGLTVFGAHSLLEVCAHLTETRPIAPSVSTGLHQFSQNSLDFAEVKGQTHAKRALEIGAAGGHSVLMIGPPGTGKTMLASRLPSILPLLSHEEAIEVTAITSLGKGPIEVLPSRVRPFRNPHHTASAAALVGGGSSPKPGEISLAHQGVLFLDELPEFNRHVLEVLREPIEAGKVTISRANAQIEFPARFQLIAAMNPCVCGYYGDAAGNCRCTPDAIKRYQSRLSGPFLDRFDIMIDVPRLPRSQLFPQGKTEPSAPIRERVLSARARQMARFNKTNATISNTEIEKTCALEKSDQQFLEEAVEKLGCSTRAYHRILKVARTIADLAASTNIEKCHLAEALHYRSLEKYFGKR